MTTERTEHTEDTEMANRYGWERTGLRVPPAPAGRRSFATDVTPTISFSVRSVYSVFRNFQVFLNIRMQE